LILFGAAGGI